MHFNGNPRGHKRGVKKKEPLLPAAQVASLASDQEDFLNNPKGLE